MFRERARPKSTNEDLSRPQRLVSMPARISLAAVLMVIAAGALWLFGGQIAVTSSALGVLVNPPGNTIVTSLTNGTIARTLPPVGDRVTRGQLLTDIRDVKGDLISVFAPITGHVVSLSTSDNAGVKVGSSILTLAPDTEPMVGVVFVSANSVSSLAPGMTAEVEVDTLNATETGLILGTVFMVSPLPVTDERLASILDDEQLTAAVKRNGPVHEVIIEFQLDPQKALGLAWSGDGPDRGFLIPSGALIDAQFTLREQSPWQALLGSDTQTSGTEASGPQTPTQAQALPVEAEMRVGTSTVELEVADSPTELETGLMFRTSLAPNHGMLFRFAKDQPATFWMKDTLIPLDIIYVRDGVVLGIDAAVPPCEEDPCPVYPSPANVDSVIELASGEAARIGLEVGSEIEVVLK